MAASKTTRTALDAAPTPTQFQTGFIDESGTGSGPYSAYVFVVDAGGNLISPAADGVDAAGIVALTGASGIRGWLSSIFEAHAHKDITTTAAAPGTVSGTSSWTSALLTTRTKSNIAVGVTSTQAGEINVQRYLDTGGLVLQGAVMTAPLSANTPAVLNILTGEPFQSFTVQITNTSGSTATLTNFAVLLPAS